MKEKENVPRKLLKSVRNIFAFGFFSSPPFFFLALILFLTLLFQIFYKIMNHFVTNTFLLWINFSVFIIVEVLIILIFLATHLRAYEFKKEMGCFKTSEFDKKIKEKNYIQKKGALKGAYLEKNLFDFLVFSFYQGIVIMGRFFWLIKTISRVFKDAIKNKRDGFNNLYGWRKLYDDKEQHDYIYYPFVLRLNKNK